MISVLIILLSMKAVRSPWELPLAFPQIVAWYWPFTPV
jgi:hypothetical protein